MSGERKLGKFKQGPDTGITSVSLANLAEQNVVSLQERYTSDRISSIRSSVDASSEMKGDYDREPSGRPKGRPNGSYGYYFPGSSHFTGNDWIGLRRTSQGYIRTRNASEMSFPGMHSNDASPVHCIWLKPICYKNPYATGNLIGVDGQCTSASSKLRDVRSVKMNGTVDARVSKLPVDLFTASSKPTLQSQPLQPSNKVHQLGSDFRSPEILEGRHPGRHISSSSNHSHGPFPNNEPYWPNVHTWTGSDRHILGGTFNRSEDLEAARELSRGPRARTGGIQLNSSDDNDHFGARVRRDRYNLQDFQTVYTNAKFFVIKSYSEDDIHKSIKYEVWASTPNGNKKLDAAFNDAQSRASETGSSCPMFLFFSVNTSGQFVGLAEMIGRVDYDKDMDFWQQDKWNGFFPVKWHIIKDIPNDKLRHIILENNDNRPVTYTRDTQEVGLKQGLQMLKIFKSYPTKTSMLGDFNFYEDREKSLLARRKNKEASPEVQIHARQYMQNNLEARRRTEQVPITARGMSDYRTSSLVELTKSLSLGSSSPSSVSGRNYRNC